MAKQHTREQVQEETTKRILAALEAGQIPWKNPVVIKGLHDGMQFNPTTDRPYRGGVNTILLWLSAQINTWNDPRWMGFSQAKKEGWHVRKGETSTVIFVPMFGYGKNDDGDKYRYVKGFRTGRVFNASQIEGIPPIEEQYEIPEVDPSAGFHLAEKILKEAAPQYVTDPNTTPCYVPALDLIRMPDAGQFASVESYWSTFMHELTHWTGHDSRLKRGLFGQGVKQYAYEELVAEMGSAFLCAWLGIEKPSVMQNHEAYIQHWIQHLNNDKSVFMDAATKGWDAYQYLCPDSDKYLGVE